jgi:hypothetical protein
MHHLDSFARDAQFILHPGLEVHVYMRGYFPVKGLYTNFDNPTVSASVIPSTQTGLISDVPFEELPPALEGVSTTPNTKGKLSKKQWVSKFGRYAAAAAMEKWPDDPAMQENFVAVALAHSYKSTGGDPEEDNHNLFGVKGVGTAGSFEGSGDEILGGQKISGTMRWARYATPKDSFAHYAGEYSGVETQAFLKGSPAAAYAYQLVMRNWATGNAGESTKGVIRHLQDMGFDPAVDPVLQRLLSSGPTGLDFWLANIRKPDGGYIYPRREFLRPQLAEWKTSLATLDTRQELAREILDLPPVVTTPQPTETSDVTVEREEASPEIGPSFLEQFGLADTDLENLLAYPYYHTFHGVVTSVSFSWSAGTQNITLQCASMLHFWQYHQMSTNAAIFGQRPQNSKARTSLVGHNFTGMHPYEIIYTLHHDTAGAAGGIAWHLSQKTNQTARSPVTGESLFSLNMRYWQQRFNQREIKLRLHGATGELFNSAQAAFLSRLRGSQITRLLRERFNQTPSRQEDKSILSAAKILGLVPDKKKLLSGPEQAKIQAMLYGQVSSVDDSGKPRFEINLAEMIAFVNNISQWGQVALFESSYESKLDIAQKVCEVTGFEFYQDVDGDFVFKPPMYNLDTSSSRVYRLEDIDIININFDEKEPQVTYMTVKGSHFKNIVVGGLEGEWGVQGQYIDYRLVAQFGWRPGNFETAYFNDPKSMFFAAINRLDIMNAPTNSCSVTIPMRPELRPGYPVYIPYLDCFYYCNSFAHSYQVGGQCTTTLQCIGKRAKFFAPGDPAKAKDGIEAINLSYTAFPPTPLQVFRDGKVALAGFPNVVMTLDPEQINPAFFLVGSDIQMLDTPESIKGLLKMGVDLNVLTTKDKGDPGPLYTMSASDDAVINFWFPRDDGGVQVTDSGAFDVGALGVQYNQLQTEFAKQQGALRDHMTKMDQQIAEKEYEIRELEEAAKSGKDNSAAISRIQDALEGLRESQAKLSAQFESAKSAFDERLADVNQVGGVAYLMNLIRRIGDRFFKAGKFGTSYGDPNATTTLLDLLADKKAMLSNAAVPGTYRYYSASHPLREHQGQRYTHFIKTDHVTSTETESPFIGEDWASYEVDTFVPNREILIQNGVLPQAQVAKKRPVWGIKVLTNRTKEGEFIPTSEIRELMFGVQKISVSKDGQHSKKGSFSIQLGGSFTAGIEKDLTQRAQLAQLTDTPAGVFGLASWTSTLNSNIQDARTAAEEAAGSYRDRIPEIGSVTPPTSISVGGVFWSWDVPLSAYLLADNPDAPEELFPGSEQMNSRAIWEMAAASYASYVSTQVNTLRDAWFQKLQDGESAIPYETQVNVLSTFSKTLASAYGAPDRAVPVTVTRSRSVEPVDHFPPVFPVSDGRGYTVIGSYRYGRDVNIDPEGVFDVLHKQDPLSMLDRKTVEDLVDVFVRDKGLWVEQSLPGVKSSTGVPATTKVFLSGPAARSVMEQRVLDSLGGQISTQQLLDLKLARATGDPNVLQLNLSNWFAEKGKDGTQKIPLVNAGYSLADLAAGVAENVCTCKAAEADVMLEIAGTTQFLQVTPTSTGSLGSDSLSNRIVDPVTQMLIQSSLDSSLDWQMSQDALRGAVADRRTSTLVTQATGLGDTYTQWWKQQDASAAALRSTSDAAFDEASEDVRQTFGED